MVTKAELKKFVPGAAAGLVEAVVSGWSEAEEAGINTPLRVQHFLSNVAVETGGLKAIVENMNYTTVAQIRKTWPSRFKSDAAAAPFVRNPRALANRVYGGRMGNAPEPSNDGYDMRGGGMMQTTGREGYRKMGFEENPGLLQTDPVVAFETAVREWKKRGCNMLADADNTIAVRKAINGGTNGLDHVRDYLRKAKSIWPDDGSMALPKAPVKGPAKPAGKTDAHTLQTVQLRLIELGYPEVGKPDGKWGSKTTAAVLGFRADHGLPLVAQVDDQLLAALMTAQKRKVSEARATTTVEDLRGAGSQKVAAADRVGLAGGVVTAGGALAGLSEGVDDLQGHFGRFQTLFATIEPVVDFVKSSAPILLLILGAYVVYQQFVLKRRMVDDYREGKYVGR